MKIMVVDDSAAMRMIVVRTMKKAGFRNHEYVEAENGVDALAKIRSDSPDIILSDWNMPQMNGIDLLRQLRSDDDKTKFGFVTTETTDAMREMARQAGALFLIGKPFNEDTFRDTLEAHLD